MKFGDLLSASWKVYRLHSKTIVSLIFVCTFIPFLLLSVASSGLAQYMGVTGTLAQYDAAREQQYSLFFSSFSQGATESLTQALTSQEIVIARLQQELLPFSLISGIFAVIVGLVGLWGTFALLVGFFGTFGNARALLREARIQYLSLFGTLLAFALLIALGFVVLFFGGVLLGLLLMSIQAFNEPLSLVIGALGLVGIVWLCLYGFLGIGFTLYEALARKTRGFVAVRGSWNRMRGKRLVVFGYSALLCLSLFVCFLPLLLVKMLFDFGTSALFGTFFDGIIFLGYMFIAVPVMYFFYGFLYKKIL